MDWYLCQPDGPCDVDDAATRMDPVNIIFANLQDGDDIPSLLHQVLPDWNTIGDLSALNPGGGTPLRFTMRDYGPVAPEYQMATSGGICFQPRDHIRISPRGYDGVNGYGYFRLAAAHEDIGCPHDGWQFNGVRDIVSLALEGFSCSNRPLQSNPPLCINVGNSRVHGFDASDGWVAVIWVHPPATPTNPNPQIPPEGTLITQRNPTINSPIYIMGGGQKRWVPSIGVFTSCGFRMADVVQLDISVLNAIPIGPNLPACPSPPPTPTWTPQPCTSGVWSVGQRVYLRQGAQIRTGSGPEYQVHTVVPQDAWPVDVIGGPRCLASGEWWDISRANIDGGGTGWVERAQAQYQPPAPPPPGGGTYGDCNGASGAYLYNGANFTGPCVRISGDISNLANVNWAGINWDNAARSIKFVGISYVRVCLYANAGNCRFFTETVTDLAPHSYEASISSIYMSPEGYGGCDGSPGVYVYNWGNYGDPCLRIYKDLPNLVDVTWNGINWDNQIRALRFVGMTSYVRVCLYANAGNCREFLQDIPDLAPHSYEASISSVYLSAPPPPDTPTPTSVIPTDTSTPTIVYTPILPSPTNTAVGSATYTPGTSPTHTPTRTPTNTPGGPSPTNTVSPAFTPTRTNTPTPTRTNTPGGPTSTPGPIQTPTPTLPLARTATSTPVVIGVTATRTLTAMTEVRGDVTCDGTADSIDALWILWLAARLADSLPCDLLGDVNGDGTIDVLDAALILQYVARLLPELPV